MKYYSVKDELDALVNGFRDNPHVTPHQAELYLQGNSRKKPFSHEQFAREPAPGSSKPVLILLGEDGFVEKPVGSLGHKSARAFWYHDNDSHTFVPMPDMVGICFFFHCTLFETLRIVLKNEWERYLSQKRGYKIYMGNPFSEFIPGPEPVDEDFAGFSPDIDGILENITILSAQVRERCPDSDVAVRLRTHFFTLDREVIHTIARELVLKRLMTADSDHPGYQAFVDSCINEFAMTEVSEEGVRTEFLRLKARWIILQDQGAYLAYELTKAKMANAYVKKSFLELFGKEYIQLQKLLLRKRELTVRISLKRSDPGIDEHELNDAVDQMISGERTVLNEMDEWARAPKVVIRGSVEMSPEEANRYESEVLQLTRDLEKLLHPDLLEQNPSYAQLTKDQKEILADFYMQVNRIRTDECIYDEDHLLHQMPSLHKLKLLKMRSEGILQELGVDAESSFKIQGKTLEEKCDWLNEYIALLEEKNSRTHATLVSTTTHPEIAEMRNVVDNPEKHEEYREALLVRMEEVGDEVSTLFDEYSSLCEEAV